MAKTLMSQLKKMNPDTNIKVGARDGTGFFYCGDVKTIRENIEEYSRVCHVTARKMKERSYRRLMTSCKIGAAGNFQDSHLWLKRMKRDAVAAYKYDDQYTNFKDLAKRAVLDIFEANEVADEDKPTVILVTGYEYGTYWTLAEAKEKGPFAPRLLTSKEFDEEEEEVA